MTNETVTATATFADKLYTQLTHAHPTHDPVGQIVAWLTERGLNLAVNLITALIILAIGWCVIRLIVAAVGKAVEKTKGERTLFGNFVRNVTSKICWSVLTVVILGRLGVNVAPIIAGLGVTGFILGFAFQESLANLAAGLMIAVNEPFKIGDYVIIAGLEGTVHKVDMMATELVTGDNKKIVIPNKSAWGAPITDFSALGRRRVDIKIGIDYSCDILRAIKIALETIPTVPHVLSEPAPAVNVASMDDSQITLNIRPWATVSDYWAVYNDTQVAIKAAFERNKIDIPFPQLTVHLDK